MSPLTFGYLWTGLAVVWTIVAFALAIGLPPGRTHYLIGWVFVGLMVLAALLAFQPGPTR